LLLLLTFQFLWQARQAQIDGVLCFLTTLSLYGLLRHLLLGPATGWFLVGWAAAGFGVITKGVGFLPLLILAPCAMFARRGWPMAVKRFGGESVAGAAALLIAIGVWFVPMMIATSAGGELLAYRNEILFQQTVTRYTDAWHHREPPWYFVVHVVPLFWLPLIALLPWLWPRWRTALRERDTWVAVLLAWVVLVLVFFSASPGKRGVYVLPALPALALAAAPWLPELLRARGPRRLAFGLATLLVSCAALAAGYYLLDGAAAERVVRDLGLRPVPVLVIAVLTGAVPLALLRVRDGWLAYLGVLVAILLTVGVAISPQIDRARSGRAFMERIERQAEGVPELGLVGYKDQYLLQLRRPVVHFGHARWREAAVEAADAAAWLVEREGRALVMNHGAWQACFANAATVDLGRANGDRWFLVTGSAEPSCVRVGDPTRARQYFPPNVSYVTDS